MNVKDFFFLIILSAFAVMIWLRDTNWMSSADDTLPILAAIPIFVWIGSPWNLREKNLPLEKKGLIAFAIFFILGILINLTLFLAISWVALLWTWLNSAAYPEPTRQMNKLLVLPLMAFPWISLDFDKIGWWFRLSGTWVTANLFSALGFNVTQEGTNLAIDHLTLNVEVACAGLNTLQSMLIAGVVVAYILLSKSSRFWWNLPVLLVVAWVANTVRIIVITFAALFISPDFATGSFHQVGGWFILILMFLLCWTIFWLQTAPSKEKNG